LSNRLSEFAKVAIGAVADKCRFVRAADFQTQLGEKPFSAGGVDQLERPIADIGPVAV